MIYRPDSFSIVLAGKWNRHVLTPIWVKNNLFTDNPKLDVQFSLNLNTPVKYIVKNIVIIPNADQVIIMSSDYSDDSLTLMEEITIKLCDTLKHTPIHAVGVNFGFIEGSSTPNLLSLFEFSDQSGISAEGWVISKPTILRTLNKNDSNLNLTIALENPTGFVFDFNYHYPVEKTESVSNFVKTKVIDYKNESENFLKTVFNLTIENNPVNE